MLVPHLRTHMSESFGVDELQFEHEFRLLSLLCTTSREVILAMDRPSRCRLEDDCGAR